MLMPQRVRGAILKRSLSIEASGSGEILNGVAHLRGPRLPTPLRIYRDVFIRLREVPSPPWQRGRRWPEAG